MSTTLSKNYWSVRKVFILRLAILFFIILSIPYDLNLYRSLSGSFFSFEDLFQLATYRTSFIPESLYVGINLEGYYNWLIALIIAIIGALLWNKKTPEKTDVEYNQQYYWLRVLLRYRLALAVIFTGIVKVLPIQIPDPSLSDLHTEYGDFLVWKLYYLTNAVSTAGYLPVIGLLEIIGGVLLLNKRTVTIGAGLLLAVLLNVVLVNYVYEIGEQVYSSFLFLIAFVLIIYDLPRIYKLLFKETEAHPDEFVPQYTSGIAKLRPYFQIVFILLISLFGLSAYSSWKNTNYPYPKEKGIVQSAGIYDVKDFVFNGDTIPYSLVDSVRWQNVVFEEWNTLSVRENTPVKIDSLKPRIVYQLDKDRNYEQIGNGGRHFYRYEYIDGEKEKKPTIKLFNKTDKNRFYNFSYKQLSSDEILLDGIDEKGNSFNIKLERTNKKYLLKEGRRRPIKIY